MDRHNQKPKIKKQEATPLIKKEANIQDSYPVFCFKYLQTHSVKDCTDHKFFFEFIFRLKKLGDLGWKTIRTSDRHGYGTEKIPIKSIKPTHLPKIVTEDVTHLIVFRATGNKLPFLGLQMPNSDVFQVIFIETTFGDIYNH